MINVKSRKKRLLSIFTAAFMTLFASGESLNVFADRADSVEQIKNVTGDSEKYAELLDVPDADDKFLGMAGDFTVFVKDKFVIPLESADIEGRLAAGKGIENQRGTYDIGSKYTGNGATVITGGGTVEDILPVPSKGAERRIFAVSSDTDVNTTVYGQYLDNFYIADGLIDFDAEFLKLEKLSKEISNYEVTGKIDELYGSYKLIGSDSEVNVFTLSEEEWSGFSKSNFIQIFVPNKIMDSYVIINVPGTEVSMPNYSVEFVQYESDTDGNPVMENGQIKIIDKINVKQDSKKEDGTFDDAMLLCGHILYNAYEAEDVGYTGSIQGSLLAVNANVHGELGGHVSGSTISKSAEGFGIQAGSVTFNPPKRIITKVSELKVSKTDVAKTDEVSGAKLMITLKLPADEKKADLLAAAESNDRVSIEEGSDNKKITWISGDEPVVIKGLPDGSYLLEEIAAPDGYTITGSVEFDIEDGVVSSSAVTVPGPDDNTVDSENSRITMVDELSEVEISKTNVAGNEIPGAFLKLTIEESKSLATVSSDSDIEIKDQSVSWVSSDKPVVLKGLPDGTYTLEETQAPDGYAVTESVKFTIENGIPSQPKVTMVDEYTKVKISKTDIAGSEIPGAKLTLTQEKGEKDLSEVKSSSDIETGKNQITWISSDKPVVLEGIPDGSYILEENIAPDRYTVTESIEFIVEKGTVRRADQSVPGPEESKVDSKTNSVTMVDAPSEVHIKKTDTAGKEIPGAKLILKLVKSSETGADLLSSDVEGGASEIVITADSVSFVSGETETVVKSIPDGDYTLTEIQAPEGYETAETITFTVEDGKVAESEDDTIIMVDEIIVTTTVTTPVTTTVTTTPVTTTVTTTTTPVTTTVTTTTTPVTTTVATTTTTPVTTTVTTTTTPVTTTVATTTTTPVTTTVTTTTTTPVTTTAATTTTPETTTVTTTTTPVTTTEATTTTETATATEETTTAAQISMPEFTFSMPEQNTGIPESDATFTLTTTTTAATSAETTPSDTTSASVSTSPALTAKTVSSTPKTGDGGRAAALMIMLGSAAAMVLVRKRND